jgi:hypothetical protein
MMGLLYAGALLLTASPDQPVPAPVQFSTAKTVFLAKDETFDETEGYKAYQKLYSALNAHRLQIVDAPARADLNLEVSLVEYMRDVSKGSSSNGMVLRLRVRDTKTGLLLWTFDENVEGAFRQSTFEKNLDTAISEVLNDWDMLAGHKTETIDSQKPVGKTRFSQSNSKQ